mgnify:CR=1 FL=1
MIIGAGGENIAPLLIEKEMKRKMPWLSNCVVFGERKPYLGMFISMLVKTNLETPIDHLDDLSLNYLKSIGSSARSYTQAKKCKILESKINLLIKEVNKNAISKAQTVKFFVWLPIDLSVPGGTLTSTYKLKRNVVYQKYQKEMDKGYEIQTDIFNIK